MAINDNALLQATRGTLFWAPAETPLPEGGVKQFKLMTEELGAWKNFGHTSNDNKISWNIDGGDATTHDTWLVAGARTTYATKNLTLTGNSVQVDKDTLSFIYNGWDSPDGGVVVSVDSQEQKLALFVLCYDSGNDEYFGVYLPNTSFNYTSLPDPSGDNFMELSFTASVNSSTVLPVNPNNGKRGTFALYAPTLFDAGSSISVTPATADVKVDGTVDLTVVVTPAGTAFTAASSDEAKATVTVNGDKVTVTGKAVTDAGKPVTITVKTDDEQATSQVTVNPKA